MLIVRSEISSTLGLKTAIWEVDEESESRRSQGDNCWLLLRKKLLLDANAIAKVKPSDLSTFVSPHGEYMWLLSDDSTRNEKQDVVRRRKKKIVSIFATFFLFFGIFESPTLSSFVWTSQWKKRGEWEMTLKGRQLACFDVEEDYGPV